MPAEDLVEVLSHLPALSHRWLSSETGPLDDAAIVYPEIGKSGLVLTLDVITPLVDDPALFGRIAAANSISDVYAMGGTPEFGLSFVGVPDQVDLETLEAILSGAAEKAKEAGCAIVGGHTMRDAEPKCGLAVIGTVEKGRAWTHRGARAGDALVLTKPIGTGVIAQALRADRADPEGLLEACHWMQMLNRRAFELARLRDVHAATDVTGFGLLGHLHHMTKASALAAEIRVARVPILKSALAAAAAGLIPGGSKRNLRYVEPCLSGASALDAAVLGVLADAQTSGGLLLALPESDAIALTAELGAGAAVIGTLEPGQAGSIRLTTG